MDSAKRTALMKLEATALFASIKAHAASTRWWYFRSMRELGQPVRIDQSLSPYRASLWFDYLFMGVECQVYLEREAHTGRIGEDMWTMSFSGIEGKLKAQQLQEHLKTLQAEGYEIPNGNENLERQMNFSLGLSHSCLMHVDIKFPAQLPPLPCALRIFDLLEEANAKNNIPLATLLEQIRLQKQQNQQDEEDDIEEIIMGDWQTWK